MKPNYLMRVETFNSSFQDTAVLTQVEQYPDILSIPHFRIPRAWRCSILPSKLSIPHFRILALTQPDTGESAVFFQFLILGYYEAHFLLCESFLAFNSSFQDTYERQKSKIIHEILFQFLILGYEVLYSAYEGKNQSVFQFLILGYDSVDQFHLLLISFNSSFQDTNNFIHIRLPHVGFQFLILGYWTFIYISSTI